MRMNTPADLAFHDRSNNLGRERTLKPLGFPSLSKEGTRYCSIMQVDLSRYS